jgi:hypothetical protein
MTIGFAEKNAFLPISIRDSLILHILWLELFRFQVIDVVH